MGKSGSYPSHRKAFSEAWIESLKLDLTPSLYRKVLLAIPDYVMPKMANPLQVRLHVVLKETFFKVC